MNIIRARIHGVIDYAAAVMFFFAPAILGLSGQPATLSRSFAIGYLALAFLTAYPLGGIRLIPFTVHGGIELIFAIGLAIVPLRAGRVAAFFVGSGVFLFVLWFLTDYRSTPRKLERKAAETGRPLTRV